MKTLKIVAVVIAALVVLFLLVGLLLPREFKVQREIVIKAPRIPVYHMVSAPTNWPKWGVWNKRDPGMQMTFSGAGAGAGAKWEWTSKTEGNGVMEFTAADSPRRVVYRLSFADWGMVSTGELVLDNVNENVTKVTWTNQGDLGGNPVFRYFGLFMDRMVGPDFEAGLAALKVLVEKEYVAAEKALAEAAKEAAQASADGVAAAAPATVDSAAHAPAATSDKPPAKP
jgi:uncharacterized protein YndB with AHSA1/START domain